MIAHIMDMVGFDTKMVGVRVFFQMFVTDCELFLWVFLIKQLFHSRLLYVIYLQPTWWCASLAIYHLTSNVCSWNTLLHEIFAIFRLAYFATLKFRRDFAKVLYFKSLISRF